MRQLYNVQLTEEEKHKFEHLTINGKPHLSFDPTDMKCSYQDKVTDLCRVHEDKPSMCRKWHCSPHGVGEGIEVRAQGWVMLPTQK